MATKSIGFAIGNLRARENSLFKKAFLGTLAAADNTEVMFRLLQDHGFGGRNTVGDVPDLLAYEEHEMWTYLNEIAPDPMVFYPFLIENDFHNAKAAVKAYIRNIDPYGYFITPSVVDTDEIVKALKEKKYDSLPEWLALPLKEAYNVLLTTSDAQSADSVLERACMLEAQKAVTQKDYPAPLARDIVMRKNFYKNIKAAIRCAKAEKDGLFVDKVLCENEFIPLTTLKNAVLGGVDEVLSVLQGVYGIGEKAVKAYEISPAEFERFCENDIMSITRRAKSITLGLEPIIGYYMAKEAEITNVRIIYSAVKTGNTENIEGRLRELYD